jgi:prepilin signal peptidase PulO-like enzyme (type II secretory pathway)
MTISLFFYTIIFVFGLTVGSFLNCVIYRLQKEEEFLVKRSYCPHCKKTLGWQYLIPVLSFVFLKGKCRYCQRPISWQYPLVELATGILFVFIAWNQLIINPIGIPSGSYGASNFLNFFYLLIVACFLIIIFVSDLRYYIIPDRVIYPAIIVALIYNIFLFFVFHHSFKAFLNPLLSAVLASAFFLAIVLISRGHWMGWGDPKLAFFMGFLLGFPNILVALFLAFFIGAIIGIGLIILGKRTLKSEIPFGPFLVAGTFAALFWGTEIIKWYFGLFT